MFFLGFVHLPFNFKLFIKHFNDPELGNFGARILKI